MQAAVYVLVNSKFIELPPERQGSCHKILSFIKRSKLMKRNHRIISFVLALFCLISILPFRVLAETEYSNYAAEQRVYEFYDRISKGEWQEWALCYAPCVRQMCLEFISNEANINNKAGIFCVNNAEVLDVVQLPQIQHPFDLGNEELSQLFSNPENYVSYKVTVRYTVDEPNAFFCNMDSNELITLVKENGEWFVATESKYFDEDCNNSFPDDSVGCESIGIMGYSDDISPVASFGNAPDPIRVYSGSSAVSVSFEEFLINTTCNEIGNLNFEDDAIIANIVAIKMMGWYCHASGYYDEYGYDIVGVNTSGYTPIVAYDHGNFHGCLESNIARITSLVNNCTRYYMLTSDGKLFDSNYRAGSEGSAGEEGGGRLFQYGSNYLAQHGYDWREILHYYYDNSIEYYSWSKPNQSIGTVQIVSCTHSTGPYLSDSYRHWKKCAICTAIRSKGLHTWVDHSTYFQCSVCGRKQTEVPVNSLSYHLLCK